LTDRKAQEAVRNTADPESTGEPVDISFVYLFLNTSTLQLWKQQRGRRCGHQPIFPVKTQYNVSGFGNKAEFAPIKA